MRFYLLYKNHGRYDPVLDDTEYIYVPIEAQELELNSVDCDLTQRTDAVTEKHTGKNGTIKEPLNVPELDEKIKTKANFHEALLTISAGDLPESARFKLPISDEYDPEGKKVTKLQKLYAKNMTAIDLQMIIEKIKQDENNKVIKNIKTAFTPALPTKLQLQSEEEMTKNESQYSQLKNDVNLETLKKTASRIVGESIDRALFHAKEIKHEIDIELENTQNPENKSEFIKESLYSNLKSLDKSTIEKDLTITKKYSTDASKTETYTHSDEITLEQEKEKLNVAEEIQKFESFNAPMDSKVKLEERRLLTKDDVKEKIEEGTVRRRSEIFSKEMNMSNNIIKKTHASSKLLAESFNENKTIPAQNFQKSQIHEDIKNIKSDTKETEERAFTFGQQTVPHLRRELLSSYNSKLLLKTFFLQLTKVMVALSKILALEQKINTLAHSEKPLQIEKNIENINHKDESKSTQKDKEDIEIYNASNINFEEQIIKKEKLSGAKIAQIEGNKPAELTEKMDIVISELLEKTILEDHSDNDFFFRRDNQSGSLSKTDENNNKNYNNKDAQHSNFFDQRGKHFDRRKLFEILEEKTNTMEIKEMISKKYTTEYKSMKTNKQNGNIMYYIALVEAKHFPNFEEIRRTQNLSEHEIKTEMKNDKNVVYVAIVEAHANINEEAILKEQMRRQFENKVIINKHSVEIKDCNDIESIETDALKLCLANTDVIEPVKVSLTVIPSVPKLVKFARSATDMEQISKKIAVQNIVHAIEPLLRHESQKMYNKKALSVIEKPTKAIAETMDVKVEESQTFFEAEVSVKQRSFVSIEKPESVVEITEIITEEDGNIPVEISKPTVLEPRSAIEIASKSVAEVSEIQIDEANIEIFPVPTIINKRPSIVSEKPILSVAESFTATAEYKSDDIIVPSIVSKQAKINVKAKIAAEISEVCIMEKEYDALKIEKPLQKQSEILHENTALMIAETMKTFVNEPKDETLLTSKTIDQQASVDFQKLIAPNINIVYPEEDYKENLQIFEIDEKFTQITSERPLPVAETLVVSPEEPKDDNLTIPQIISRQSAPVIEMPFLKAPESIIIATEGPKENDFILLEPEKQVSNIDIKQLKSLISNIIFPQESYKNIEISEKSTKLAQILIEKCSLVVALTLAIFLGGPMEGKFEKPSIVASHAKILIEMPKLMVAEITTKFLEEPKVEHLKIPAITLEQSCVIILENTFKPVALVLTTLMYGPSYESFEILKTITNHAKIVYTQLGAILTSYTYVQETKEQDIEISAAMKKLPQVTIENCLVAPEILTIETEGPKDDIVKITKPECDKSLISLINFKAIEVITILLGDSVNENLKVLPIVTKKSRLSKEDVNLHIANVFTVYLEEPRDEPFNLDTKIKHEARVKIEELKAAEVKFMPIEEPAPEELIISEFKKKQIQTSLQSSPLTVAQTSAISSIDSVNYGVNILKTAKQKACMNVETLKSAEAIIILPEEPKEEILLKTQRENKTILCSVAGINLLAAETSIVQIEENEKCVGLDIKTDKNLNAHVKIEEQKALETRSINIIEPKSEVFVVPLSENKHIKTVIEKPLKTVAQVTTINTNEIETQELSSNKNINLQASVSVEELKTFETMVTNIEEPKIEAFQSSLSENRHVKALIEQPIKATAQVTVINTGELESKINTIQVPDAYKNATLEVESAASVAQHNIITAIENTHDLSHEHSTIRKSAKSSIVESSMKSIAKINEKDTDVNVLIEKPKSKPTKIQNIEIEANFKIPTSLDFSVNEVSAEYNVKVPQEENVYAEYGFGERKINVDIVSEIYESIRLMKKQAFQKQSMEASLSLARELQTKIEMAELDTLQEEFIKSGSISNSSSMASSPLTPILEEYFFNVKGPSFTSRYRHFQDVFEEASLKLKSKIQTSTIQNLDANLTLILQDLAMAHSESETNNVEVIEIDDYEDVRDLHFSTAIMARSREESVASFLSSEAQSLKAMHASSVSRNLYGYAMSVEDLDLKEFIEADSSEVSLVSQEPSAIQYSGKKNMEKKASKSVKFADSAEYAELQCSSAKLRTSEISEIEGNRQISCEFDIPTSGEIKSLNVNSLSVDGKALEISLVENKNIESSFLETTSIEEGSMKMSSAKNCGAMQLAGASLEIQLHQGFDSSSARSTESHNQLSLKTNIKEKEGIDLKSPSPPTLPPTPLTDEYMFRLQTKMPEPSEFIPRDCSFSPESVEEDIILKGGLIPCIRTRIERILYSPPYITPPTSPDKTVPIYSKGGGKSGIFKFLS